jgi:hypothetical protein
MAKSGQTTKAPATKRCPICGHESWRIIYGMVMPDTVEQNPKAEFAGCVMMHEQRIYPATGHVEWGLPMWACQSPVCRHRWW